MAKGINKVILIGNLGADPEMRYSADGTAIAKMSIATSESWKDKKTGQYQDRTEWHRVTLFSRLAEISGEYLRKGSKVYLEGSLRTNKWQDKEGNDRYTTEIVANSLQMLDAKGTVSDMPSSNTAPAHSTMEQPAQDAPEPSFDDEIPF